MPLVPVIAEDSFAHILQNRPSPVAFLVLGKVVSGHSKNVRGVDGVNQETAQDSGDVGMAVRIVAGKSAIGGVVVMEVQKSE